MNVKTMITGLALSMLLSSGTANADWGDVYYCQMTSFDEITLEGEKKNWKLEKFQFKLDKTRNAMAFGNKKGALEGGVYELTKGWAFPNQEAWYAKTDYSTVYFEEGKFMFSQVVPHKMWSITADCDKF
jgi:hypothetical protein